MEKNQNKKENQKTISEETAAHVKTSLSAADMANLIARYKAKAATATAPSNAEFVKSINTRYTAPQSPEALFTAAAKAASARALEKARALPPISVPPKPVGKLIPHLPTPPSVSTIGGRRKTRRSKKRSKKTRRRH